MIRFHRCAFLFLMGVLNTYMALSRHLSVSPYSYVQPRDSVSAFQGKMSYNGVSDISPLAGQLFARNTSESSSLDSNSSSLLHSKAAHLKANFSSRVQNKFFQLNRKSSFNNESSHRNVSAPSAFHNKGASSNTNISPTSPKQPVFFSRGACRKPGASKPALQQKLTNSTTRKLDRLSSLSLRPSPLNQSISQNLSRRWSNNRANPVTLPELEPDPELPEDPHQAWEDCRLRGMAAWNILPTAYTRLEDNAREDITDWNPECDVDAMEPVPGCASSGLLQKISDEDNPPVDLCDSLYNWWYLSHASPNPNSRFWYSSGFSTEAGTIINSVWGGGYYDNNEQQFINAPNTWAELAFPLYINMCRDDEEEPSSLQYIAFTDLIEGETELVLEDMRRTDPTLADRGEQDGSTRMATYTPDDDNFFALLGTKMGIGAIEFIYNYPRTFSRIRNDGTRMVKTIRNVRLSGSLSGLLDHDGNRHEENEEFIWVMAFTLQDIEPDT